MTYVEIIDEETGCIQHRELKQEGKNYHLLAQNLFSCRPHYDPQGKRFEFIPRAYTLREVVQMKDIKEVAQQALQATDYAEYRVSTPERTPTPEWLVWREKLREVVRGNVTEIPPEPERYNAL